MWQHASQQLLQLLADRKHKLREEDTDFVRDFMLHESASRDAVCLQIIQDSQLVRAAALLLKRVLEQHRLALRSAGWHRADYCRMVHTAASLLHVVCHRVVCCGQPVVAARMSMSQQLAVSGVLQQLPATLTKLASMLQSSPAAVTSAGAAHAILDAVTVIIAAWPGSTGVLSSQDAGPIARPAVELASALEQHMATQSDASIFALGQTVRRLIMTLAGQVGQKPQQLILSLGFLRLLLTFIAVDLVQLSEPASSEIAGVAAAPDGPVGPGQQHTIESIGSRTLGAATTAAAPPPEQHTLNHVRQQQTQLLQHLHPTMQLTSSVEALMTLVRALKHRDGEPSSVPQLTGLLQVAYRCIDGLARAMEDYTGKSSRILVNDSSSSSIEADTLKVWLPDTSLTAALRMLPTLLLCVWRLPTLTAGAAAPELLKAVSKLVCETIECWDLQLWMQAAGWGPGVIEDQLPIAQLQDQLLQLMELQVQQHSSGQAAATNLASRQTDSELDCRNTLPAATAAGSNAAAGQACLDGAIKHSFIELLAMLVHLQMVTESTHLKPAALACMLEYCFRASSSSSFDTGIAANSQSRTSSSSSSNTACNSGNPSGSGCCELIDDPRLPLLCGNLVNIAKLQRPNPGSSPCRGDSTRVYHDKPGLVLLAARAGAPGSREQQQLFTMLISLSKRARTLPKQVQICKGAPERVTALHGRAFFEVVREAANEMLKHNSNSSSSSAAGLAAVRPWLFLLGRNLVHLADQLDALLEYDPTCGSWEWYLRYLGQFQQRSGPPLLRYSDAVKGWTDCVLATTEALLELCLRHSDDDTSHSTTSNCTVAATQHTEAAAGTTATAISGSSPQAAAGVSSSGDAVTQRQLSQLLLVQHQLQSDVQSKVEELQDLCNDAFSMYPTDPVNEHNNQKLHSVTRRLEQLAADPRQALAAAATAILSGQDSAAEFVLMLNHWGIKQLQQQLVQLGSQVCAALPLSDCCNSPGCSNMRGASELHLVSGKGCVCARCETARYCGRECQVAHWQQHKETCKVIKRQKGARQLADWLCSKCGYWCVYSLALDLKLVLVDLPQPSTQMQICANSCMNYAMIAYRGLCGAYPVGWSRQPLDLLYGRSMRMALIPYLCLVYDTTGC